MRIGVITHWNCFENYGQILQGYVFQRFMKVHGHDPFIIKYIPISGYFENPSWTRMVQRTLVRLTNVRRAWQAFANLVQLRHYRMHRRRVKIAPLRDFEGFRAERMTFTRQTYHSWEELIQSKEIDADVYSVGSDVVWNNVPFSDEGRVLFLDFGQADAKRISYSASFGCGALSPEYKRFVSPLLAKLDHVGVRESSGVELCREMGRDDAVCVVDPVFLMTQNEYREKFSVRRNRKGVMGYFLSVKNKIPFGDVECYAKSIGEQFCVVTVYGTMGLPSRLLRNPNIDGWVRGIGEAKLLVTNSFHGTSLAIIFHTPFVVFLRGDENGLDARLHSLLNRLGLKNRIYDYARCNFNDIVMRPIDWNEVDRRLNVYISESISFLSNVGILSED